MSCLHHDFFAPQHKVNDISYYMGKHEVKPLLRSSLSFLKTKKKDDRIHVF